MARAARAWIRICDHLTFAKICDLTHAVVKSCDIPRLSPICVRNFLLHNFLVLVSHLLPPLLEDFIDLLFIHDLLTIDVLLGGWLVDEPGGARPRLLLLNLVIEVVQGIKVLAGEH